jgi:hypothetical protein
MTYKGVVGKVQDSCYLFFEKGPGVVSDGVSISDSEGIYKKLEPYQLSLCSVEFCDGTTPMPFESFGSMEEIFLRIKDLAVINISNKEGEANAMFAIKDSGGKLLHEIFKDPVYK